MHAIGGRNVNDVFHTACFQLQRHGVPDDSRNGPVLRFPSTLRSYFEQPCERVLWNPVRDANPFFHLMEACWMLAGSDDVEWLAQFNKRMREYADRGVIHGAYGHRWRSWWRNEEHDLDQLDIAVDNLTLDPSSRRVVIQMWDPRLDARGDKKDHPCNVTIVPFIRNGRFHMSVFSRSHDILWGLYGANTVTFSILQQYLADRLGVPVGGLEFLSVNAHAYRSVWHGKVADGMLKQNPDLYALGLARPYAPLFDPSMGDEAAFKSDAALFLDDAWETAGPYAHPFWFEVAIPFRQAWHSRADPATAEHYLRLCDASDWRIAGARYLERHRKYTLPPDLTHPDKLVAPRLPITQAD